MQFPGKIFSAAEKTFSYTPHLFRFSVLDSSIFLPFPFLKIGLSNAVVLKALPHLSFFSAVILGAEKAFISGFLSGMIATPFFLLSFFQSLISALAMFFALKLPRKYLSETGASIFGAATSSAVQIALASVYLGRGVFSLLPTMLVFSIFSGALTAQIAGKINFDEKIGRAKISAKKYLPRLFLALSICAIIMAIKNIAAIAAVFLLAVIFSAIKKMRVRILSYIALAAFSALSALFSPKGRIIFSFFGLCAAETSLKIALQKTLSLISVSLFSRALLFQPHNTPPERIFSQSSFGIGRPFKKP